jgi:hypothetical protein
MPMETRARIVVNRWTSAKDAVRVIAERLREIERTRIIDLEGERKRRHP